MEYANEIFEIIETLEDEKLFDYYMNIEEDEYLDLVA
jgi:hypothetical protein